MKQNRISTRTSRRWSRLLPDRPMLFVGLLITVGLFSFGKLAEEMVEGDTRTFDVWLLLALRSPADHSDPLGPHWLEEVARDFTALGSYAVITFVTATVIGYLLLVRKRGAAMMVTLAVVGGVLLSNLLKHQFGRPRPDLVPHGVVVYTQSFPSGHAMMSAVVYLTLGALLARIESQKAAKLYLLVISILLTFIVGVSRVYLGVHWPTDVLAGWAMGASWALICFVAMMWLQNRGQVETDRSNVR